MLLTLARRGAAAGALLASLTIATLSAAADAPSTRRVDDPRAPSAPADSLGKKANAPPKVAMSVSPPAGTPSAVTVDAAASFDPDGAIASYHFDFGDGAAAGPQPSALATHVYAPGVWILRVTVTDDSGQPAFDSMQVTIAAPAPPHASVVVSRGTPDPEAGFVPLITDPAAAFSSPLIARPEYLEPSADPTFGTLVTRLTGTTGDPLPGSLGTGVWASDARHHYSKDQPWNADHSLLMLEHKGTPRRIALDGDTYEPRFAECPNYERGDDRWHPRREYPHVRINARGAVLSWFDVVTCTELRRWTLPFPVRAIGDGEGNPSRDGRYLALCDSSRMFVVDMDPQPPLAPWPNVRIGPVVDFLADCALPECRLGWVSVSPSGKYVVCKYGGDYPRVYDLDPQTLALTPRPMPENAPRCHGTAAQGFLYDLGHCDMTLDPFDGDEDVLIGQEHCGWRGATIGGRPIGGVVMARLRDGAITPLTDPTNEAYPHHVSAQNVERPGWAYVGYYPDPGKRFSDEIVAVKLDGSLTVERWAHKHSDTRNCYRCEAHAVPSRDGRRVVWASNWAIDCVDCGPTTDIKPYLVDARVDKNGASGGWFAPVIVTADASGSWDEDGNIVSYAFDFGDGAVAGPASTPRATHTYGEGVWTLSVTVTDDQGVAQTTSTTVTVGPPPNLRPTAALALSAAVGAAPFAVTASAAASSDPDGQVVSYAFDFGDGVVPGPSPVPTTSHVYAAGTWTLRVVVADDDGKTHAAAQVVHALPNLITNPTFEASAAGWGPNAALAIERVPGGRGGGHCLEVRGPATTATFGANDSPNAVAAVALAGARHRFAAWVRSDQSLGQAKLRVREYLAGVQQGSTLYSSAVTLGPAWQLVTVDHTALAAGSTLDFQVVDAPVQPGEVFQVDDVSVVALPAGLPTSASRSPAADEDAARGQAAEATADLSDACRVWPNPMSGRATLRLSTSHRGPCRVEVCDVQGRIVRVLLDTPDLAPGRYDLSLARDEGGARLPSGIFFYRVRSAASTLRGKLLVVN